MNITDVLRPKTAEQSLLIGYYGGGNYGDELLLEVVQNLCKQAGVRDMMVAYQTPENYGNYHHEFGYPRIDMRDKMAVVRAILHHRRIIVGGGGLWGLDFNSNVFLLSFLLFVSRWLFGKKVYLIGIGYYNSTTRLGRLGAALTAKAATAIIARDQETFDNFRKLNKRTYLDTDIAWYIRQTDLSAYKQEVAALDKQLPITDKTLFVALRRFQSRHRNDFTRHVAELIEANPDKKMIVALLEPKHIDPEHHELISQWEQRFENVQGMTSPCNPLALFLFFREHAKQLALIGPQFHIIITAHLNDVPFLPIVYDNKVSELMRQIGRHDILPIKKLNRTEMQAFVTAFYGD